MNYEKIPPFILPTSRNPGIRSFKSPLTGVGLNELLGGQEQLPSHLIWQKCVDLSGRTFELLNQFQARRSAYRSGHRTSLHDRGQLCHPDSSDDP